jgi:hypothetical protein
MNLNFNSFQNRNLQERRQKVIELDNTYKMIMGKIKRHDTMIQFKPVLDKLRRGFNNNEDDLRAYFHYYVPQNSRYNMDGSPDISILEYLLSAPHSSHNLYLVAFDLDTYEPKGGRKI